MHTYKVDRKNVCSSSVSTLGQGNFGDVNKVVIRTSSGSLEFVAAKIVRIENMEHATAKESLEAQNKLEQKLIAEAKMLSRSISNYIVQFIGFCVDGRPYTIFMEYMENKDLVSFLKGNKTCFKSPTNPGYSSAASASRPAIIHKSAASAIFFEHDYVMLVHKMALELADAMLYLEHKNIVHRDLAARNCMVSSDCVAKVGDFELTRLLTDAGYYRASTPFSRPIRWMAPENFSNLYTSKSDVFSFGILLWELVTKCEMIPYSVSIS